MCNKYIYVSASILWIKEPIIDFRIENNPFVKKNDYNIKIRRLINPVKRLIFFNMSR